MEKFEVLVEQKFFGNRQTTIVVEAKDEMAARKTAKEVASADDDWMINETEYQPMDAMASRIEDDDE